MKNKLRAAIVGSGAIATGIGERNYAMTHLKCYENLSERVDLIAFVETSEERRQILKKKLPSFKFFESAELLLSKEDINILSICTPDCLHEALVCKAIYDDSIKGIWCEKPLALTMNGARKIINKSKISGISIQVNYFRRFIPELQRIREDIINGVYGDIQLLNGFYADFYMHNGCHLIDLIHYIIGDMNLAYAKQVGMLNEINDGPVFVFCEAGKNVPCMLQPFSRKHYNIFELDIFCEKARIRICENGRRIEIYRVKIDDYFSDLKILNSEPETVICSWEDSFLVALTNLVDVVDKKSKTLISSAEHSLVTTKIIQDISQSL